MNAPIFFETEGRLFIRQKTPSWGDFPYDEVCLDKSDLPELLKHIQKAFGVQVSVREKVSSSFADEGMDKLKRFNAVESTLLDAIRHLATKVSANPACVVFDDHVWNSPTPDDSSVCTKCGNKFSKDGETTCDPKALSWLNDPAFIGSASPNPLSEKPEEKQETWRDRSPLL